MGSVGPHDEVFCFVLQMADERQLLKGKTVAVDAATLESNAAMKSIVRQETGEDWKAYVTRLMKADRGKRLQRQRSKRAERSFAHVCETGGRDAVGYADWNRSTNATQ